MRLTLRGVPKQIDLEPDQWTREGSREVPPIDDDWGLIPPDEDWGPAQESEELGPWLQLLVSILTLAVLIPFSMFIAVPIGEWVKEAVRPVIRAVLVYLGLS